MGWERGCDMMGKNGGGARMHSLWKELVTATTRRHCCGMA